MNRVFHLWTSWDSHSWWIARISWVVIRHWVPGMIRHWIWHTKDKWELLIESCSTFTFIVKGGGCISISCQVPENNRPYPCLISMGYLHKLFKSYIWKLGVSRLATVVCNRTSAKYIIRVKHDREYRRRLGVRSSTVTLRTGCEGHTKLRKCPFGFIFITPFMLRQIPSPWRGHLYHHCLNCKSFIFLYFLCYIYTCTYTYTYTYTYTHVCVHMAELLVLSKLYTA